MVRKATGRVDGLVVESPVGGRPQRAAPRRHAGRRRRRAGLRPAGRGRPREDRRRSGVPFYLAGGYGLAGAGPRGARPRRRRRPGRDGVRVLPRVRAAALAQGGRRSQGRRGHRDRCFTDAKASPDRLPVQGARPRGDALRADGVPRAPARLRPRLPAPALQEGRRQRRLPLPGGARGELAAKGGAPEEHRRAQVPVQRAARQHRRWAASGPVAYLEKPLLTVGERLRRAQGAGARLEARATPPATSSPTSPATSHRRAEDRARPAVRAALACAH